MSKYIHFTEEEKSRARQIDIVYLLQSHGEKLKRSGSEYEWWDGGQKVTIRGNVWFHQYERVGGDAIDFVQKFFDKSYPEAVAFLLGECGGTLITSPPVQKETKPFELPPKNHNMRRVFAYLLNRRGVDAEILQAFVSRGMIYESSDYHNAVFVGYDMNGVARHAHKRGTGSESQYKRNAAGSIPEFSFHWFGTDETIYLFEAPIDMLSFISMHQENWKNHSYAASCSVSDRVLFQCLKDNPNMKKVYLCFDSDSPGQSAAKSIAEKLKKQNIDFEILVPTVKDWNEDLLSQFESEAEKCQALQF